MTLSAAGRAEGDRSISYPVVGAVLGSSLAADLALAQGPLGALGGNALLYVAPPALVIAMSRAPSAQRLPTWLQQAIGLLGAMVVVALVASFFVPATVRGEIPLAKAGKVSLTILAWLLVVHLGFLFQMQSRRRLWAASLFIGGAYLIALSFDIYGILDLSGRMGFLHATPNLQQRPRGLATEASNAGASVAALTLLCWISLNRGRSGPLLVIGAGLLLPYISSEGTLGCYAAAAVAGPAIWLATRRFIRPTATKITVAAGVLAFIGLIASPQLIKLGATGSSDRSISAATRSTLSSASVIAAERPWEATLSTYVYYSESWIVRALDNESFSTRETSELGALLYSQDDRALSPKTLPSTFAFMGGLLGLLLVAVILREMLMSLVERRPPLSQCVALAFVVAATFTYQSSLYVYPLALLMGALMARTGGETNDHQRRA